MALPRSSIIHRPPAANTCACVREMVFCGSSSTSVLSSARPIVPPASPNVASCGTVGMPLNAVILIVSTSYSPRQAVGSRLATL